MRMLFFLREVDIDFAFQGLLHRALESGHEVHVALALSRREPTPRTGETLHALRAEHAGFSWKECRPPGQTASRRTAARLREALEYVHYLKPDYLEIPSLVNDARTRAPRLLRPIGQLAAAHGLGTLLFLEAGLRRMAAAMPASDEALALLREEGPDVLAISPRRGFDDFEDDLLGAARRLGIPSSYVVCDWDSLLGRDVLVRAPDLTIVWNEAQAHAAVHVHRLPTERVVVAGAHHFDVWLESAPTSPDAFAARVGLEPGPFVVYASAARDSRKEVRFVDEWIHRVRASSDPVLRRTGIVVRAQAGDRRLIRELRQAGCIVLDTEADHTDALRHCSAVVSVDTLAILEAATVGRPVLGLRSHPHWRRHQRLRNTAALGEHEGEGLMILASGLDEHLTQLPTVVADPDAHLGRTVPLLQAMVRAPGDGQPAGQRIVDELERAAIALTPPARPDGVVARLLRPVSALLR
jgi:hypothetical protein